MKTLRYRLYVSVLTLTLLLAGVIESINSEGAQAQSPTDQVTSILPIPPDIFSALAAAVRNRPVNVLPGDKLIITSLDQQADWAISTVAVNPTVQDEGESILSNSSLAIATYSQGKWSAAIMGTREYEQLLSQAPGSFISEDAKPTLRSPEYARFETPLTPSGIGTPIKWPWRSGVTWQYTQGRHGTNNSGIDLAPFSNSPQGDRAIVAAKGGVVIRRCDDSIQSNIALRHTTGSSNDDVTGYLHLDKNTVSLPTGTTVNQGDTLGYTYNGTNWNDTCGYGTGPHVHFYDGIIPAGSNNSGSITLIDIAGINISGWSLGTDNCFRNGGSTACVYSNFTSDNGGGGGGAPTAPSNPNPSDNALVGRTTDINLSWNTNGSTCDIHIWGGPGMNTTQTNQSCSSFHLGSQWPGAYQWQVTAKNNYGSTQGPTWHFNVRPYSPTNLSASPASQTQINLNWIKSNDDPGSVDSYKVYFSNGNNIVTLGSGTTSYTAGNLTCATSYSFYVTAVRQGVESDPSNTATTSTQSCGSSPSTPSSPSPGDGTAVGRTNDTTFSWSTNGTSCDINIWGGPNINTLIANNSCSSLHWGQQWPGAYQWYVTAHNSYGTTTGPTWHLGIRPYAPTNLNAFAASQTQINLTWTKSGDDPGSVDAYNIYYGNGSYITQVGAGVTNAPVGSLTCGTSYSFYVRTLRQGIESDNSNTANAATLVCIQPTVSVTAVRTGDGNGNPKSVFNPGDSIDYIGDISNTTGGTQTTYFDWEINGPCGRIAWWQGNLNISPGTSSWRLPGSISNYACSGTYTYQLSVNYNGSITSKSTTFTVSSIIDPRQEGPVSITGSLVVGGQAYFTVNIKNYGNTATPAIHPYIEGYANGNIFWRADGSQPGSAVIQPGQTVTFQDTYALNVAGTWQANGIYLWNNDAATYWKPLPANGQNQQFQFTVTDLRYLYLPLIKK